MWSTDNFWQSFWTWDLIPSFPQRGSVIVILVSLCPAAWLSFASLVPMKPMMKGSVSCTCLWSPCDVCGGMCSIRFLIYSFVTRSRWWSNFLLVFVSNTLSCILDWLMLPLLKSIPISCITWLWKGGPWKSTVQWRFIIFMDIQSKW